MQLVGCFHPPAIVCDAKQDLKFAIITTPVADQGFLEGGVEG